MDDFRRAAEADAATLPLAFGHGSPERKDMLVTIPVASAVAKPSTDDVKL